jgi:hypothetical protein
MAKKERSEKEDKEINFRAQARTDESNSSEKATTTDINKKV